MYEIGLFQSERREWELEREQTQVDSSRQALEIRRLSAELEVRPEPDAVQRLTEELATERRRSVSLSQPPDSDRQPDVPGSRTCLLATISCLQANLQREKERAQALEEALEIVSKENVAEQEQARGADCQREASLLAKTRELDHEALGLREELNAEKEKALEAKLAEQSRRTAWRSELSRIEQSHAAAVAEAERLRLELSKKETETRTEKSGAAEKSPQKLREILSMFLTHVQEPLAVVRGICTDLCTASAKIGRAPPPGPSPMSAASGEDAVVGELVKLVELLRFFATAVNERRSLRTPERQAETADEYDGCRRARPLPTIDASMVPRYPSDGSICAASPTHIRSIAKVPPDAKARPPSDAIEWVNAIDDTVERLGVATAAAVSNSRWVGDLDETTDRIAEWLLSKVPP